MIHRNADLASIEAALTDLNEVTIAVASATARIIPLSTAADAV